MTHSKTVSVKLPSRIIRAIPPAHRGRSRFIIEALEEKISRSDCQWEPKTAQGKAFADIWNKGAAERTPLLDAEEIGRELRQRRGAHH